MSVMFVDFRRLNLAHLLNRSVIKIFIVLLWLSIFTYLFIINLTFSTGPIRRIWLGWTDPGTDFGLIFLWLCSHPSTWRTFSWTIRWEKSIWLGYFLYSSFHIAESYCCTDGERCLHNNQSSWRVGWGKCGHEITLVSFTLQDRTLLS